MKIGDIIFGGDDVKTLVFLMIGAIVFPGSILILDCVDSNTDELVDVFEIHAPDFRIDLVKDPTLGEAKWRIAKLSKEDSKILIFIGEVLDSIHLKLSDTNPDYLKESSIDLRSLNLGARSLVLIFTDSDLDPQILRRMGWEGKNVIVLGFDKVRDFLDGLKESADENGDGYVSVFEIADHLSGKAYAFVSDDWKITLTSTKISEMAFKKVMKLFKSGNLKMEDALLITKAVLLENEDSLLFGVGKMNVADLLSKLKGR